MNPSDRRWKRSQTALVPSTAASWTWLQIEHAPHLSPRAKLVKLADKISNLRSLIRTPPAAWSRERQQAYVMWGDEVMRAGLRGCNAALEQAFDGAVAGGKQALSIL